MYLDGAYMICIVRMEESILVVSISVAVVQGRIYFVLRINM